MYAVVGCDECRALWIVEGRPETTGCPTCGRSRTYTSHRKFVTTDDVDRARRLRAAILAERQGKSDAFADLVAAGELADSLDEPVVSDEEYLTAAGINPESVGTAGDRATGGCGGSTSAPDCVREALTTLDAPTRQAITEYAGERGVSTETAGRILDRLVERGEVIQDGGTYRPI